MCRDTIRLSDVGWKLNITWINRVSNIKNRGGEGGGGKEENLISFYSGEYHSTENDRLSFPTYLTLLRFQRFTIGSKSNVYDYVRGYKL